MHPILNRNQFFVREHVGMFKAANNFDVLDPQTGETIIHCREDNLGFFTKLMRFSDYKTMSPFDVELRTPSGEVLVRVRRGWSFFLSSVDIYDEKDQRLGYFKQRFFSVGGKFDVFNKEDKHLCTLRGKWTSWEFTFEREGREFAMVSKKWAGLGKEFFTTADNYVLKIEEDVPKNHPIRSLILAAVMCIDLVLKE